ncbi:MAG: hypothetical protein ACFFD7_10425 [Candidatus Thorarchaeota archaeon]
MGINELQKWNIAEELCRSYDVKALISQLSSSLMHIGVKLISKPINFQDSNNYSPIPYKATLIDFE